MHEMMDGAVIGTLELGERPFEEIVMDSVADIPASARKAGTKDAISLKIKEFAPNHAQLEQSIRTHGTAYLLPDRAVLQSRLHRSNSE